jgi:hypothetical protein
MGNREWSPDLLNRISHQVGCRGMQKNWWQGNWWQRNWWQRNFVDQTEVLVAGAAIPHTLFLILHFGA